MNLPPIFRRFSRTAAHAPEAESEDTTDTSSTGGLEWDTSASALASKTISGFLVACLVAGPVALLLALLVLGTPSSQQQVAARVDKGTVGERAAVSAFAEDFVSRWLRAVRGEEHTLEAFLGESLQVDLPERGWKVSDPATAHLVKAESGLWSVTVSATTWTSTSSRARRYFVVPVSYADGALVAAALPAPVAAPLTAPAQDLVYRYPAPSSSAVTQAVSDFLTALLAGSGDLTRYVSPGADIRPVAPPPYPMGVKVSEISLDVELVEADENPATGRTVHALVSATGSAAPEHETPIQYPLTLVAREGRWEIASIDQVPLIPAPESTDAGTPSTRNS